MDGNVTAVFYGSPRDCGDAVRGIDEGLLPQLSPAGSTTVCVESVYAVAFRRHVHHVVNAQVEDIHTFDIEGLRKNITIDRIGEELSELSPVHCPGSKRNLIQVLSSAQGVISACECARIIVGGYKSDCGLQRVANVRGLDGVHRGYAGGRIEAGSRDSAHRAIAAGDAIHRPRKSRSASAECSGKLLNLRRS